MTTIINQYYISPTKANPSSSVLFPPPAPSLAPPPLPDFIKPEGVVTLLLSPLPPPPGFPPTDFFQPVAEKPRRKTTLNLFPLVTLLLGGVGGVLLGDLKKKI